MIRKLQKKFIAIAVLSVTAVLVVVLGVVNLANYYSVVRNADLMLTYLSSEGGLPGGGPWSGTTPSGSGTSSSADGTSASDSASSSDSIPSAGSGDSAIPSDAEGSQNWERRGLHLSTESAYTTRYFTVSYDSAGAVSSVSTAHIASVTSDDAESYAAEVVSRGRASGFYGDYRYLVTQTDSGAQVIFLDCEESISGAQKLLLLSVVSALICLAGAAAVISVFSRRAVKPLADNMEKQKQFISNAGHELKTPITIISTNAEILSTAEDNREWTESIQKQVRRLNRLVQELIRLAKMDEIGTTYRKELFPISDMAQETADAFLVVAQAEGKTLTTSVEKGLEYTGNEDDLRELISILLDNAIKYSTAGADIEFSLTREGKATVLKTANPCEPMSEEQMGKLTDRFYRADESHSSEKTGYGLGLSIAAAVAERHRGSLEVETPGDGLIAFVVRLQ